jgi:hypothetical protein
MNERDRRHDVPDDDDARLEAELRGAADRFDPVPAGLLQAALDAFGWRTVDAELAELVFDSLLDPDDAALMRGSQGPRLLSFRAGELTIEVEITSARSSRGLVGQIVPPQQARVEIRHGAGVLPVEADDLGRFSAGSLPAGPISLRCRPSGEGSGPTLVTDWVPI